MSACKSNTRDASPTSKTGVKTSSDFYKIKKQTASITTTKIPMNKLNLTSSTKFNKEERNISPTYSTKPDTSTSKKTPTNSNSLHKKTNETFNRIVKPQSQNFNTSRKEDIDKGCRKSVSKDKSLSFNSASENNQILVKPATTNAGVVGKKAGTSLLEKFEMMKNNRKPSSSPNNVANKQKSTIIPIKKTDVALHTRNKSKNSLKDENLTPKTNPESTSNSKSNNSSKTNTKTKVFDAISKSKEKEQLKVTIPNHSPLSRINRFEKSTTTQGKINFRDINTSPLLLNKNKLQKKADRTATSTSGSKDYNKTSVKPVSIAKKQCNNLIQKYMNKEKAEFEAEVQKPEKLKKFEHKSTVVIDSKESADQLCRINKSELKSDSTKIIAEIALSRLNIEPMNFEPIENYTQKYINKVYEISRIGYSPGEKKVNQDNYFIHDNFLGNQDAIFMAVCDGHGGNGHYVSKYLRENLPIQVNKEWMEKLKFNKGISLKKHEYEELLENCFRKINNQITNNLPHDTSLSGSTCVSLIYNIDHLTCANVGDSRCTIGRRISQNVWKHHDLSRDHKPDDKEEMTRIKVNGGRIEPYYDENGQQAGPHRVWLMDYEYPGLAMSRSFGDKVAASVGVIAIPEIIEWKLTEADRFIILASDGLWEFMESNEVVNIVKDYYLKNDIQGAAEYLVKESSKRWMKVSTLYLFNRKNQLLTT